MSKTEETVVIPVEEYEALLEASLWLSCLEQAGVDNWGGIEQAQELLEELLEEEEDEDE